MEDLIECIKDILFHNLIRTTGEIIQSDEPEFRLPKPAFEIDLPSDARVDALLLRGAHDMFQTQKDTRTRNAINRIARDYDYFVVNFRTRDCFADVADRLASNHLRAIATLEARPGMPKRYFTITKMTRGKMTTVTDETINPLTYKIISGSRYTCTRLTAILPVRRPVRTNAIVDDGTDDIHFSSGLQANISYDNFIQRYNTSTLSIVRRNAPRTPTALMVSDLTRTHHTNNTIIRRLGPRVEAMALRTPLSRTSSNESKSSTQSLVHQMGPLNLDASLQSAETRRRVPQSPRTRSFNPAKTYSDNKSNAKRYP